MRRETETGTSTHHRIAIIGTGFSGIATAVKLLEQGEDDLVLYERSGEVGGTWRDNTYPGCACDVPSHLYSFSFAPNPGWSRSFSGQAEIQRYLVQVAESLGITRRVRFNHELITAAWDEDKGVWSLQTSQGPRTTEILISGVGGLSTPSTPEITGLEKFTGPVFHSAEWDHEVDLDGRNVAVIGTGASAIQFVPKIQPEVARVNLFQRTPPWVMPRRDREVKQWEKRLYSAVPSAQKAVRSAIYWGRELFALPMLHPWIAVRTQAIARRHLKQQVQDPELRRKLTPDYAIGCKRILQSNDYYPSLARDNVEVITDDIRKITSTGIVTADGTEVAVDTIIFGTGFNVIDLPLGHQVRGRDGRTLHEIWQGSPNCHLGTSMPGFPNFFTLMGPNTGLGHTSVVVMIEAQVGLIAQAIRKLRPGTSSTIEPTPEAMAAWRSEVDRMGEGTVWTSGGCNSWYLDRNGKNSILWPSYATTFRRRLARIDPSEYVVRSRSEGAAKSPEKVVN
ncbi:MAG: NAD(P)/FAD-dependent oxidoreductase [Solirubrobacterales bacterium]